MSDIVERLRVTASMSSIPYNDVVKLLHEAADEIKRLEDECETLRGAAEIADEIRWRE